MKEELNKLIDGVMVDSVPALDERGAIQYLMTHLIHICLKRGIDAEATFLDAMDAAQDEIDLENGNFHEDTDSEVSENYP